MSSPRQTPWLCTYTGKRVDIFNPTVDSIDIVDIVYALNRKYRFTGHMNWTVLAHTLMGCLHLLDDPTFRNQVHGYTGPPSPGNGAYTGSLSHEDIPQPTNTDPITWKQLRIYGHANPSELFPCRLFLMHDMTEAYLPDVNSLLKPWCRITNPDDSGDSVSFSDLENSLYPVIFEALQGNRRWGLWTKPWNRILEVCNGKHHRPHIKSLDLALCRTEAECIGEFLPSVIADGNFGPETVRSVAKYITYLPFISIPTRRSLVPPTLPVSITHWWDTSTTSNGPSTPDPYTTFEPVYLFWLLLYCLFPYCSFWQTDNGRCVEEHLQRMLPENAGLHHLIAAIR